jgi:hypothetical protein
LVGVVRVSELWVCEIGTGALNLSHISRTFQTWVETKR